MATKRVDPLVAQLLSPGNVVLQVLAVQTRRIHLRTPAPLTHTLLPGWHVLHIPRERALERSGLRDEACLSERLIEAGLGDGDIEEVRLGPVLQVGHLLSVQLIPGLRHG